MQSQKKNSRSYLIKHNSTASQGIRQIFSNKRKLSVASQTDTLPSFCELTLQPFEYMTPEETKYCYSRTVHFLNSFHHHMNRTISNVVSKNDFQFPEVSNFYHIFDMIMKSSKRPTADKGIGNITNKTVIGVNTVEFNDLKDANINKYNDIVGDNICTQKETEFINCQYLNRNNVGDGPIELIKIKNKENDIISNTIKDEMFQFDTERRIYWSRTRQVKSERDVRFSDKVITDSSEENINCCRTFQSCINENLVLNTKEIEEISESDDDDKIITARINSSLNLMEYTLKKLSAQPCDDFSDEETTEEFLTPPVPEVICNYFNVPTLNKVSHTPHKVNEMFKKISNENSSSEECKYDNMYIKYISNQNLADDGGFCDNCKKHCTKEVLEENDDCTMFTNQKRWNTDITSSSDCISSDEEFRNLYRNGYFKPINESVKEVRDESSSTKEIPAELVRSHPLELTERDRCFADEKMLKAIGLFTDTGDIRPGILETLETERQKPPQRPSKNVQFRAERKLDVEVRYNNKNINMDANKSDESVSDKDTYDVHKEGSIRSSAVTVSSLISESDLTDMLPPINDME